MFRLMQFIDVFLVLPMLILGFMVGLSGGGLNSEIQQLAKTMIRYSPMGISCAILAEFAWRFSSELIAYGLVIVPIIFYGYWLARLQKKTGFFFQKRR